MTSQIPEEAKLTDAIRLARVRELANWLLQYGNLWQENVGHDIDAALTAPPNVTATDIIKKGFGHSHGER
jgi:hypothetical protein